MVGFGRPGALAAIALAGAAFGQAPAAAPYSRLIVFGDSLSDVGNAHIASGAVPAAPNARGRFSNGPVWIEHVAAGLGLEAAPALGGGTNHAFGGARAGPADSAPPSLLDQVARYLAGPGAGGADPDALYAIAGGANDLLTALDDATPADAEAATAVGHLETALRRLAAAGARRFLVVNMPDLGRTPLARARGTAAEDRGTALASAFNRRLEAALDRLEAERPVVVARVDVFALMRAALADPGAYGFADVTEPCQTADGACAAPDARMFWDAVHPTAAAHARLGAAVLGLLGTARPAGRP